MLARQREGRASRSVQGGEVAAHATGVTGENLARPAPRVKSLPPAGNPPTRPPLTARRADA